MSPRILLTAFLLALTVRSSRAEGHSTKPFDRLGSAPESARALANPYQANPDSVRPGAKLFARYCSECHGQAGHRGRRGPSLESAAVQNAPAGVLFWYLTNGDLRAGMPSWSRLPEAQRWQIATFLKAQVKGE